MWRAPDSVPPRRPRTILVVNGHPDPRPARFCAGLSAAYVEAAEIAGLNVRSLALGDDNQEIAAELASHCNHLVLVFPLWLNKAPSMVDDFLARIARLEATDSVVRHARSTRVVVTMDMPALFHRAILRKSGNAGAETSPIPLPHIEIGELTLIGSVETIGVGQREEWLAAMRKFGQRGS
jgi:putative NADPH-quinone reductase